MKKRFTRFLLTALLMLPGVAMVTVAFDADARRLGGGTSIGRQVPNVTQRRAITPPPAANSAPGATSMAPAPAAAAGAAAAGAKSGASRWLGPIAGIAAGLGLAALLSHLGLSGAFAEFMFSVLLIALVAFAVLFIIRRLRGGVSGPALQSAYGAANRSTATAEAASQPLWRQALKPMSAQPMAAGPTGEQGQWFIPSDFDTPLFLQQAKEQFIRLQALWDSGDTGRLREFLTDDLMAELAPQMAKYGEAAHQTEVVLLNAELLGIEAVSEGHLASVRFSGMLREAPGTAASRFEEVWNLFKGVDGGWLLAGIQQIPVEQNT